MARQWGFGGIQVWEEADAEYGHFGFELNEDATTPLVAGTIALVSSGPAQISLEETVAASGGEGAVSRQWERNEDGGAYSTLVGETGATLDDTDVTPGILYGYRINYTDEGAGDVDSNVVTAEVYEGGVISGSGGGSALLSTGLVQ